VLLFAQDIITWLTAISSHCLATLPAKMPASKLMRQGAYYRNVSKDVQICCHVILMQ